MAVAVLPRGLTEADAAERLAARGPADQPPTSRSYATIIRANVFTVFNLILLVAGVATLAFGEWQDALFLGVLVANSGIGIAQEVRAKRALDRLAALIAPDALVLRDGVERRARVEELVPGDVVRVQAGDQIVADGKVADATGLAVDESILTGETRAVTRGPGDELRSGSFAVEGVGTFVVGAVGADSYAARVAGEARAFRHPRSPLERALNRLLLTLVAVIMPLGVILGVALHERHTRLHDAVPTSVAAVVTLVPEGLILLASLTYAVGALRMARRGALAQQLNAIESIASVDVVCLDKTGTLTEPRLRVVELAPRHGVTRAELEAAIARYAAAAPARNATLQALADAYPAPAETSREQVPFASRRRFGGVAFDDAAYVLGAPELFPLRQLTQPATKAARKGRRVVAVGRAAKLDGEQLPGDVETLGLAVLAETLRPQAAQTVAFFREQGVELKVLSGDRPETVAAIARDAGLAVGDALDGGSLPADPGELQRVALTATVVGRITPEGKRRFVEALRDAGRYVAMIGDGVNDVPALKAARLAIAQGTGSQMTRSIADLVLVRGDFAAVPAMVGEGRKVLRNLQRVAKLFVTKSAFAAVLILSIGLTPTAYPLLPRHLTLVASLTIGIPSFFLALAPSSGSFRSTGFLRDVARFAVPAGTAAALGVLSSYLFALNVADLPLVQARTVAATALLVVGLYLVLALEASGGRRGAAVSALCAALAALYAVTVALPFSRHFFALAAPGVAMVAIALVGAAIAIGFLWLTDERFVPDLR